MEKHHPPTPQPEWLDIRKFHDNFPGGIVTLMPPDFLQQELELLHEACAPAPDETARSPSGELPSFEDKRNRAFVLLIEHDVLASPADVEDARHALRFVPPTERVLLHEMSALALNHLRACHHSAPLFLVSPYWSTRMADAVSGDLYPAQIHHRDVKDLPPGDDL